MGRWGVSCSHEVKLLWLLISNVWRHLQDIDLFAAAMSLLASVPFWEPGNGARPCSVGQCVSRSWVFFPFPCHEIPPPQGLFILEPPHRSRKARRMKSPGLGKRYSESQMPAALLLVLPPLTVPKALWICAHKRVWSIVSSSGLLRTREMWSYWGESSEGPLKWLRDWSVSIFSQKHPFKRKTWESEGSFNALAM